MDDIASENTLTPALPLSHRLGATQGHLLLLPPTTWTSYAPGFSG